MRIPGTAVLHRLLHSPSLFGDQPLPLHDTSPDPGFFGPSSVTWRVMREPMLLMLGGRALLMQAANPLVAQGAIDHSAYASDPSGRLQRTIEWVTVVTFGTKAEAREASRHVNRLHRKVSGTVPRGHGTRRIPAGTHYSAMSPDLLRWVHATLVENSIVSHDALIGGLTPADRDTLVREWNAIAALMGVPRRLHFESWSHLHCYIEETLSSGAVEPGGGSRRVARTILAPPLPLALRPLFEALMFLNAGLLPDRLRRGYRLRWTVAHSAAHSAACLWFRSTGALRPRALRVAPVYDAAMARVDGHFPGARAA